MRYSTSRLIGYGTIVVLALSTASPCAAFDPDDKKEKLGIIGVLTEKEFEKDAPGDLNGDNNSHRLEGPERDVNIGSLAGLDLDIDLRREELERLSGQTFGNTDPVSGTSAAERELERLRDRHRAMSEDFAYSDAAEAERIAGRRREFDDRWGPAADAVNGGRPSSGLRAGVDGALANGGSSSSRRPQAPLINFPLGTADRDAALEEAGLGGPPSNNASDGPQLNPNISKLADAIKRGERPEGISEYDWARLSDAFEDDLANLDAEVASKEQARRDQRQKQLDPLEAAIEDAEAFIEKVKGFRDTLTDDEKKFFDKAMAWRLHKAKLAAAKQALRDAETLKKEREGEGKRPTDAITGGLGGAYKKLPSALEDAMRNMDTSGHSQPPSSAQMDQGGLQYPEWIGTYNLKDRVESKLHALRPELSQLEYLVNNAQRVIRRRDRLKLRMLQFQLEAHDRLRLRLRQPIAASQRRTKLRELAKELRESRSPRIADLKSENQPRIEYLRQQIQLEEKRLSVIEEANKPEPEPDPDSAGSEP